MVRIHAPEPAFLSDVPALGHKSERQPLAVAVPDAARAAPSMSIRADMRRALADGLTRALAAGDDKAARIALTALSGLMDDAPEAAPVGAVAVVDPMTEGRRREW
jgi:hypothetical protein